MIDWEKVKELNKLTAERDTQYKPDKWQKKVLAHKGNISLRTGRQVGKSVTIARKSSNLAIDYNDITILMIAAAQRQSSELFQKTLRNLYMLNDEVLKQVNGGWKPNPHLSAKKNMEEKRVFEQEHGIFKVNPTKTECTLKNGTRLLSLPTGKSGAFVRCYTVDILIGDEAAYIPEPVWIALRPMLATSKEKNGLGWEILLSTPFGRGGHYYECCHDEDYLNIHISSEDCRRISRDFLKKEKKRMSKMEYAQEYLGEFISEFNQFFPTTLIKDRMTFIEWSYKKDYDRTKKYYLGIDIARYGADENAFVIAELTGRNQVKIIRSQTTERKALTDTVGRAMALHKQFNFKRIFTDDTGLGAGVTDMLIEKLGKRLVFGINNSSRTIQEKKKGILKEDLYSNALSMMERNHLDIISDLNLQRSLKSMTYDYTSNAKLRIYGKYSHLAEAFVRACWCVKAKNLKLFIA